MESISTRGGKCAERLSTLRGARVGLLSTGKRNCDALLDEIGALLVGEFDVAACKRWTKPSVYRFSPVRRLNEIKANCDAAVVGLGDCGHGSSCTFHDVYWLEEQGIPVACIDTPGRLHQVRREGDVYVVEYFTLKYVVADWQRTPEVKRPERLRTQLEKQGIYRALRMAGAQPGDRVRLLGLEFVIDELPPPPRQWSAACEGIPGYEYIVTDAIGRLDDDGVKARARDLLPRVVDALLAAGRSPSTTQAASERPRRRRRDG